MATIDKKSFFDCVRGALFAGTLKQPQVDGIEAILSLADFSPDFAARLEWTAYALGTAYLETDKTMQPIGEYGGPAYFKRMYDIQGERPEKARELGNLQPGDGVRYHGRGYVQLTGRGNYKRLGDRLGVALEENPEFALDATIAARVMAVGMAEGIFTGRKLASYFPAGGSPNWVEARRIINGLDRAHDVAAYAQAFYNCLQAASLPAA